MLCMEEMVLGFPCDWTPNTQSASAMLRLHYDWEEGVLNANEAWIAKLLCNLWFFSLVNQKHLKWITLYFKDSTSIIKVVKAQLVHYFNAAAFFHQCCAVKSLIFVSKIPFIRTCFKTWCLFVERKLL